MENIVGQTFERLTVLYELPSGPASQRRVFCRCICGNEKAVRLCHLKGGRIRSCGCLLSETRRMKENKHGIAGNQNNLKHGLTKSPEYYTWRAMKARCCNRNNSSYPRYGIRGISVCDRWLESFDNFYSDMGPRPSGKHSIERRNNNGNYTPENCYWATAREQASNRSTNRRVTYQGETLTITQWANRYGLSRGVLWQRVFISGWSFTDAINTPKLTR